MSGEVTSALTGPFISPQISFHKILKLVFVLASREGFVVMPSTKLALFNPLISLISDESRKISMDLDYKIYSKK